MGCLVKVRTQILLQCSNEEQPRLDTVRSNYELMVFKTVLHSKCACPGKCQANSAGSTSVGLIIMIVCSCLIIVYFVGGMVFNRIAKGASGKKLIPNSTFWFDLPYLVKDGVVFVALFFWNFTRLLKRSHAYGAI